MHVGERRELSTRCKDVPGLVNVVLEEPADWEGLDWGEEGEPGERVPVAERKKHFEDKGQFPKSMGALDWVRWSEGHSGLVNSHVSVLGWMVGRLGRKWGVMCGPASEKRCCTVRGAEKGWGVTRGFLFFLAWSIRACLHAAQRGWSTDGIRKVLCYEVGRRGNLEPRGRNFPLSEGWEQMQAGGGKIKEVPGIFTWLCASKLILSWLLCSSVFWMWVDIQFVLKKCRSRSLLLLTVPGDTSSLRREGFGNSTGCTQMLTRSHTHLVKGFPFQILLIFFGKWRSKLQEKERVMGMLISWGLLGVNAGTSPRLLFRFSLKLDHVTCWSPFPLAFEGVLFIKRERPSHVEGAWEIAVKQVRLWSPMTTGTSCCSPLGKCEWMNEEVNS